MIRFAVQDDIELLLRHDHEVPRDVMARKIANRQVYIVLEDQERVGWLRYGLLWDLVPFMNMLYVLAPYRSKGYGRQLVERWEKDMRASGYRVLVTSTLSDESAQHFYRKLGYIDTGALLLPGEATEIIMRKDIRESK